MNEAGLPLKKLLDAVMFLVCGIYALHLAHKGVWKPGHVGSRRPPVKQEWPTRLFAVFVGLSFLFGAVWLLVTR